MPGDVMADDTPTPATGSAVNRHSEGVSTAALLGERIAWLIRLRWIAVAGVACTIELAHRLLGIPLPRVELYAVMVTLAGYNALLSWTVRALRHSANGAPSRSPVVRAASIAALAPVFILICWLKLQNLFLRLVHAAVPRHLPRDRFRKATLRDILVPRTSAGLEREWDVFQAASLASAQISVDLVALATLLHFSGGIENPFRYFFIFHVILSSMLLSRRATFMQTALGWLLMTFVAAGEFAGFLAHYPLAGFHDDGAYRSPTFVLAQLIVLGVTLGLSAYMAGDTSRRLRQRERETVLLGRALARNASLLESAYEDLRATERAKSQYMRKVAHELRGPLGTIRTALRVALDGLAGEVTGSSRTLIERAEKRAAELAQVTVDLLSLSQARDGRLAATKGPVDLAALVTEVVGDLEERAHESDIALERVIAAPGGSVVEGDLVGLREMVRNLVGNAVRYTPGGGRVSVSVSGGGDVVLLCVTDTGIGIAQDDLPRIFDEFFRASAAREHSAQGTGLGLAIVKAVADKHKGTVTVDSTPGKGTRFEVSIPRIAMADATSSGA